MQNDWPAYLTGVSARLKEMRTEQPDVMKAFSKETLIVSNAIIYAHHAMMLTQCHAYHV